MTTPPARPGAFGPTGRRLLRVVRVQRAFASMFVLGLASISLNIIGPRLLGHVTDLIFAGVVGRRTPLGQSRAEVIARLRAQGHDAVATMLSTSPFVPGRGIDFAAVAGTLTITAAVYAVSGLCWIAQGRQATAAIQAAALRLRADVEEKLARLPLAYFDANRRGEILSRATNDLDNITTTLQQTMSQLTNSVLLILGLLGMMFWISPLLAVVAVVVVPAAIAVTTVLGRQAQPQFSAQWTATGELSAHVEEVYSGHAVITVLERREAVAAVFRAQNEAVFQAGQRAQFLIGTLQPSMNFINNLGYVLIAVLGCLRIVSGGMSIGDVQAFMLYSRQLSGPLTQVTSLAGVVQSGVASAQRVFELLDAAEQSPVGEDGPALPAIRGLVRFESVSFRYDPGTPLIDGLSLTAEPGRIAAIVGPTGAGKTTLVNLLMRFYDVTGGRITIDGTDIATVPRRTLRSALGLVLQDTWLFTGTIADNIGYGRPEATRAEIEAAAREAHADHFIRTLPAGYDTVIEDDGVGVSAGERQLITIARAFLADPAILVFDEATSAVDSRTEMLIRQALERLSRARTSFVIAHRLSTVRDADTILVMDHGTIVAQGSHDDLITEGGVYADLYRTQFAQLTAEAN